MSFRSATARIAGVMAAVAVVAGSLSGCRPMRPPEVAAPSPEPVPETPPPPEPDLEVTPVQEEIVVAAWSEPKVLPEGGGQAQILVRVQKRGGKPFPGVEVRLQSSYGTLYSRGRVLTTAANGMTRDRLTTRRTALITLNAGGTRYRFQVPVLPEMSE